MFAGHYRLIADELAAASDSLTRDEMVTDPTAARRLVAVLGAAQELAHSHLIDGRGRCRTCRGTRTWWPVRSHHQTCSVYEIFSAYLTQPHVLPAELN
ncbi:MAG: hypothetical protein DLM59_18470 [Pseudonocardiales bacterium]|nr:MAG: hypothetical protein DLM59_18470 [Pseudonocardiales bacterium]